MKIIINRCYGGFRLSDTAFEWLMKNKKWKLTTFVKGQYKNEKADVVKNNKDKQQLSIYPKYFAVKSDNELRINKDVIECVESLGQIASGSNSVLKIVEIPENVGWEIEEYDGIESIHETHRVWF